MNLNDLAIELSMADDARGRNIDVIDAKIVLKCLMDRFKASDPEQCRSMLRSLLSGHPAIDFEIA